MSKGSILYVPIDYAESVGRAAIGWGHLEMALDSIVAVGAKLCERRFDERLTFPEKVRSIQELAGDERLAGEWKHELRTLAEAATRYWADLSNATHGTLYGRGVEEAALKLRLLHERDKVTMAMRNHYHWGHRDPSPPKWFFPLVVFTISAIAFALIIAL